MCSVTSETALTTTTAKPKEGACTLVTPSHIYPRASSAFCDCEDMCGPDIEASIAGSYDKDPLVWNATF